MVDGEREVREEFSPTGLAIGELGCMTEDFKVFMIRKDFELMGTTFKVVSPFTKSFDDGEEFSIINIIIPFSFDE